MKNNIFLIGIMILIMIPQIFAGVGIKWDQDSKLVNEGERTCLTYSVYNPWPEETWVAIEVEGDIQSIITDKQSETKLIPSNTPSKSAIPVEFCFVIPDLYPEDCWIADKLVCKKDYQGEIKTYVGEVVVKSVPSPMASEGSGGSTTAMAVSAPLRIRVNPNNHPRNFTFFYIIIAAICLLIILGVLYKRYSRTALERDEDRLKKLQDRIKKEKNSIKKNK